MDLGFRRRKDSEGSSDEKRSLSQSFSEGSSKFFSSVIAKKNGLFNDISSKFETTFLKTSSSESSLEGGSDGRDVRVSPSPPLYPETSSPKPKVRPGKTKNFGPGPNHSGSTRDNDIQDGLNTDRKCQAEALSGVYSDSGVEIPSGINISFDEPLYNGRGSDTMVTSHNDSFSKPSEYDDTAPPHENDRKQQPGSYDASSHSGISTSSGEQDTSQPSTQTNGVEVRKGKFTKLRRRSSTVDEMLFDDFVEDEKVEEVDVFEDGTEIKEAAKPLRSLLNMGDLISFDMEDLPPPGINVTGAKASHTLTGLPSNHSLESNSETELKGYFSTSVDSSDAEFGGVQFHRSASMGSEKSWTSTFSTDSQPDDLTRECMDFMKNFVQQIFNPEEEISQTLKAKFGEMTQESQGRLWFARYVNTQRVNNKKVDERIFFRLVQYFALVLFECNEAEDFSPAKSLMNMCFTFFHEGGTLPNGRKLKFFLYSYLKEQPIWQSIRFWSAAFFDAVQCERARRPMCTSEDGNAEQADDRQFQENITFGQLGTFTCNMRAFGLSRELCQEFLRKQCTIANLRQEQVQMLKDNVEKWKDIH